MVIFEACECCCDYTAKAYYVMGQEPNNENTPVNAKRSQKGTSEAAVQLHQSIVRRGAARTRSLRVIVPLRLSLLQADIHKCVLLFVCPPSRFFSGSWKSRFTRGPDNCVTRPPFRCRKKSVSDETSGVRKQVIQTVLSCLIVEQFILC